MPKAESKSLQEKMTKAFNLSCDIHDAIQDKGLKLTEEQSDMVYGYCDGLMEKFLYKRMTGQCSLKDFTEFDPAKFEEEVDEDIDRMKKLLGQS